MRRLLVPVLSVLSVTLPTAAAACRMALVLALDVSSSVDAAEYRLQAQGMARALLAPQVADALLSDPGAPVAVAVLLWSGVTDQRVIADWSPVDSPQALDRLAARIAAAPRPEGFTGRTAIGAALLAGLTLLDAAPVCDRQVIDLATDGRSNAGPDPQTVVDGPAFAEVTVNGLAIGPGADAAESTLARYLRLRVTRGVGSFVETATDYADFERAMTRKLERELQGMMLGALR